MANVKLVFNKHKPATKTISVKERKNAQARIFGLLQLAEEMKLRRLRRQFQITAKSFIFHHSLTSKDSLLPKAEWVEVS